MRHKLTLEMRNNEVKTEDCLHPKSENNGNRCDTCRFFRLNTKSEAKAQRTDHTSGNCKRYPPICVPTIFEGKPTIASRNPVVNSTDWCGEHQEL